MPLVGLPMMLLITGKENGKTKRNRQCGKDLLWTTSSVYGTYKKEDIELFIEKANAYHPTHNKFFLLVSLQRGGSCVGSPPASILSALILKCRNNASRGLKSRAQVSRKFSN